MCVQGRVRALRASECGLRGLGGRGGRGGVRGMRPKVCLGVGGWVGVGAGFACMMMAASSWSRRALTSELRMKGYWQKENTAAAAGALGARCIAICSRGGR